MLTSSARALGMPEGLPRFHRTTMLPGGWCTWRSFPGYILGFRFSPCRLHPQMIHPRTHPHSPRETSLERMSGLICEVDVGWASSTDRKAGNERGSGRSRKGRTLLLRMKLRKRWWRWGNDRSVCRRRCREARRCAMMKSEGGGSKRNQFQVGPEGGSRKRLWQEDAVLA